MNQKVNAPILPQIHTLGDIFALAINIILGVGWAMMFVMLALGLVNYIISKGEPKAVKASRDWLVSALLGGMALFFFTSFQSIFLKLLGLDPTKTLIGNQTINPFPHR